MQTFIREDKGNRYSGIFVPLISMVLLASCAQSGSFQTPGPVNGSSNSSSAVPSAPTSAPVASYQPEPLIWESSAHPERAAWSSSLYQIISSSFTTLNEAKDVSVFCPNYANLTQNQQINLWADIFAGDAYYESSWDPTEYSVDVGTANDNATWSVGLLQMSVVDQQNYGFNFGFSFADLQTPTKNLQLAVAVMAKQVAKHGTILIPAGNSGLYWATMSPGGKYDHTADIVKMTEQLSFCH